MPLAPSTEQDWAQGTPQVTGHQRCMQHHSPPLSGHGHPDNSLPNRGPLHKPCADGFSRTVLWEMESKAWLKSMETSSTAFPSALWRVTHTSKDITFIRQDLPFLNPHCQGLSPQLSSMGHLIPLTTTCSRALLGPEVRLTGLQFPSSSLRPFLATAVTLASPGIWDLPSWPRMTTIKDGTVA